MDLTNNIENNGEAVESEVPQKARKRRNPFNVQKLKEEKERRQKKKARLIVRNISYKATEDALRKHFGSWGTLEDVSLLKRPDGKLVGCAFIQYENVNQATKAISQTNNKELLGRPIYVDWALGKDEYKSKQQNTVKDEPEDKKPKVEIKSEDEEENEENENEDEDDENENSKSDSTDDDEDDDGDDDDDDDDEDEDDDDDEDKKDLKSKLNIDKVKKEKHTSNDVKEGCTVFIKNVPFDATDNDLRKVCRKFGPVYYAIVNREQISGHSKGTAFIKFKTKESADLCLQAGPEFTLMDQMLEPFPALSRDEIHQQANDKNKTESKDSRNLYLAREGLIMSGSKAAEGVSASDMTRRHKLEQIKTQVLKNLNRFVSRNRLSIHNLPLNYDNDNLKQMAITYTGFKPHECRVMRENKITAEHPKGKSKGFGFMSFSTHKEALTALRKLNNNPKIFSTQHRPIVAFSIEDRAVQKMKDKREQKSKLSNPTYQEKLQKRKESRQQKRAGRVKGAFSGPQSDDKEKLRKHIKKLEESRAAKAKAVETPKPVDEESAYMGTAAKREGTTTRMRSFKKIREQAQEHMKRVKTDKRKAKQRKIQQIHLAERKAEIRPKQGRKTERDDLMPLVNKYKTLLNDRANGAAAATSTKATRKAKKPKRTKWYTE